MNQTINRRFFDEHQWQTVEAATARIMPTDHEPGAREADVVTFIDRYLSGLDFIYANAWGSGFLRLDGKQAEAWSKRISNVQARYAEGLRRLDKLSRDKFGRDFVALDERQQDEVLHELSDIPDEVQAGSSEGALFALMSQPVTDDNTDFFETLVLHTRLGFYSDPAYGGNKDHVGWKVIGFPGPASLAETNQGRYSTLEYMTGGDYESYAPLLKGREVEAADGARGTAQDTDGDTSVRRSITSDAAARIVRAAEAKSREIGVPANIAVVDETGNLKAFVRMDGAPFPMIKIAQDKAYTAAGFGLPTDAWYDVIKDDPAMTLGAPVGIDRFIIFGGGYPLKANETVVGAIGVSGGMVPQDMQIALAGLSAFQREG